MEIKNFICESVFQGKSDHLSQLVAEKFAISRQTAQKHIKQLIMSGMLTKVGQTKGAKYKLAIIVDENKTFDLSPGITEDMPWRTFVRPLLDNLPQNIISICQYGFTEMFNNAIDHSSGSRVMVSLERTAYNIKMIVDDDGIGIFKKIKHDFDLDDERHAIFELAKGKLTSDPTRHTGEGIFFTSRMFDNFVIWSDSLFFTHTLFNRDFLFDDNTSIKGTTIIMEIRITNTRTTQAIFDEYAILDHPGFYRTIIPVLLAKYGDENMISRSQAKRVLARVEKFTEVVFDFEGVNEIGQAFADEIFRVFSQAHPQINLMYFNANDAVEKMIRRAQLPSEPLLPGIF
jgi:anti-sigma regulatory factor (Ser/Thr protein kinase)/biotin operon repressor